MKPQQPSLFSQEEPPLEIRTSDNNPVSVDVTVTYRIVRPDQTIRWIRSRAYPVFDDNGALHRIAGVAEDITDQVQSLFLAGKRDEAAALIPDKLVDELHIIGDEAKVRDRVQEWEASGVTTLLLSTRTPDEIRRVADALL